MTAKTGKKIRFLYGLLLSFSAAVAGICLIAACLSIYHSGGEQIYTTEKVSAAFSQIAWGVYPFLALAIGSILLELALPSLPKAKSGSQQPHMQLQRFRSKANMQYCGPQLRAGIEAQQKSRKLHIGISLGLLILGSAVFLIYALDSRHFHQSQVNASMIAAMQVMLPCLIVPFGYSVFTAYHNRKSILKECELLKTVPKCDPAQIAPQKRPFAQSLKWGFFIVAVALLVYGYFAGGTADVLTKAVNICTECVGLG